ncbi:MAG: transcriptional regulator, TetR family [Solirubrobacterales bacterium]|jgi:AcrR family transcriptional regulator|nr:transcriptional regulator, TetR family [Solirubrobacterales bacterium]MCW3025389.1 transcriptional regulator, TetR family [Solirubrobacterales bacterium]
MRILAAIIQVVCERGMRDATVEQVVTSASVSRRTFYELFADRDDCLLEAIEQSLASAGHHAGAAWEAPDRWADRVRGALWALLEFFEEESKLADLCFVHALQGSSATVARRLEICRQLARLIDQGRSVASHQPPPLTAEGTVGGALAVVHARLLERPSAPLTELLNPLMSFIVMPYLGPGAAGAELSRPLPVRSAPRRRDKHADPLDEVPIRLTYRTMRVLVAVGAHPGLKNSDVSGRSGISDEGQASKLLARLARVGLIENTAAGTTRNATKAWRLTRAGERLERSIRPEVP